MNTIQARCGFTVYRVSGTLCYRSRIARASISHRGDGKYAVGIYYPDNPQKYRSYGHTTPSISFAQARRIVREALRP